MQDPEGQRSEVMRELSADQIEKSEKLISNYKRNSAIFKCDLKGASEFFLHNNTVRGI